MARWRALLSTLSLLTALSLASGAGSSSALAKSPPPADPKANETTFLMNDVGATVVLPPGWKMERWADWELKAKTVANDMVFFTFMTPWQTPPSKEAAAVWAESYKEKLKENKDLKVTKAEVGKIAGRDSAIMELSFNFPTNNAPGVWKAIAFNGAGKIIHMSIVTGAKNAAKADEQLKLFAEKFQLGKPAIPVDDLMGEVKSEAAYVVTTASGWRKPTDDELKKAEEIAAKTGQETIDYKRCVLLMNPQPLSDPDITLFCNIGWHVPYTDERSWKNVEKMVYEKFFKSGEGQVPHAEKFAAGERQGFFYQPSAAGAGFRMSVTPYNQGILVGWGISSTERATVLDADFRQMASTVKFTGADGGKQLVGAAGWVGYYFRYKPWHPLVWAPTLLILGAAIFGSKKLFSTPKVNQTY